MHRYRVSAGMPQRIACRKSLAPGTMSAAIPIGPSIHGSTVISANSDAPRPIASHSDCRHSGAISSRRPAPSSCETDGGSAISVPIGTIIGSQNSAVPTATAARVVVPWWPATTASTKPTNPCDRCPAASGAAKRALRRTSSAKRGVVDMEVMRNIANAHAGADARGLPS